MNKEQNINEPQNQQLNIAVVSGSNNLALEKAQEMMLLPMKDLPKEALEYLKYLSNKVGMCMEVCLTAYCAYNQMVLNMPCNDDLYIVSSVEKQWWIDNGYCH